MRTVLTLCLFLLCSISYGQYNKEVADKFAKTVCECLESAVKIQSEIGEIVGSNNGNCMSESLLNSSGVENTYCAFSAFKGGKEFLNHIKELQNNEIAITIFCVEEELFFKTENADKSVVRIETVKY